MDMRKEYVPPEFQADHKQLMDDLEAYYRCQYMNEAEHSLFINDIEKFKLAAPVYERSENGIITEDELKDAIAKILFEKPLDKEQI